MAQDELREESGSLDFRPFAMPVLSSDFIESPDKVGLAEVAQGDIS